MVIPKLMTDFHNGILEQATVPSPLLSFETRLKLSSLTLFYHFSLLQLVVVYILLFIISYNCTSWHGLNKRLWLTGVVGNNRKVNNYIVMSYRDVIVVTNIVTRRTNKA